MLYYFFRALENFGIPGSAMWGFISFRALLALIFGLSISLWFGERFIKYMRRHHIGETARDASIDPFGVSKVGVPSMGGIIILVATLVPAILLGRLRNIYLLLMIVTTIWFGAIGFLDDYIKIFRKNKEGLAGRWKLIGQALMGLIVGLTLYLTAAAFNAFSFKLGETLGGIGLQSGKVIIGVLAVIVFGVVFLTTLDVLNGTVVLDLTVGLQHVLILSSKLIANLGSGHLVIQVLCGLQLCGSDFGKLGIEDVKDKVHRAQQRKIDDGRKNVLRLLEVNLVCYFHVSEG